MSEVDPFRTLAATAAPVGCSAVGRWIMPTTEPNWRNLNAARFIDPIAPNLLQASAQTLAPVPPGELQQNP
jgi:hypothetical protein